MGYTSMLNLTRIKMGKRVSAEDILDWMFPDEDARKEFNEDGFEFSDE